MGWTHKLNKLLSIGGVKVHRVNHEKVFKKEVPETAGALVELFGVSGVGKSFFYQTLPSEIKKNWHSRRSMFHCVNKQDGFALLDGDESELVDALLRWKYEKTFSRNLALSSKVKLYDFHLKSMSADIIARSKLLPSCGCLNEDSLIKLYAEEMVRWYEKNGCDKKEVLVSFLQNRHVVLIDAPDEYILENLKRRNHESSGVAGNNLIAQMGVEEAMALTRENKIINYRCFELIKDFGVPTLMLDATADKGINEEKFIRFLESAKR